MMTLTSFTALSDADLLTQVTRLATDERRATAQLVASLAELDARRLYLGLGCSSMFTYCTQMLHLSEHAAYNRIEAARIARRFPVVLDRLADGAISLTTVCLLAAHLTSENHREVLDAARHKSKREVELLVARLRPLPPVPAFVRKLPGARTAPSSSVSAAPTPELDALPLQSAPAASPATCAAAAPTSVAPRPSRPAIVAPLTPEQYKVQVTVGRETIEKLRRVQNLIRHTVPDGDPAVILDRALTVLLRDLERTKLAVTDHPQKGRELALGSRHIPAAVRRAVWARDGSQCAFVGVDGRRCQERGFLELHHTVPYAAGGDATIDTIQLRCRAHNLYEAALDFGPLARDRSRALRAKARQPVSNNHEPTESRSHMPEQAVFGAAGGCSERASVYVHESEACSAPESTPT